MKLIGENISSIVAARLAARLGYRRGYRDLIMLA